MKAVLNTVAVARDFLQGNCTHSEVLTRNFAETIAQLANCCVIGIPCGSHGGAVHGQEAEELRAGVEQILKNTADVTDVNTALDVLRAMRKSLIFLLDHISARDSLSFCEATDPSEVSVPIT